MMIDLIDRQAAIEALKEHEDDKGYLRGDFEEILEALPSAEPFIIKMDRLVKADEHERLEKELCRKMTRQNLILLGPEMELVYPKRKGKWIEEKEDWRNQIMWVSCSECGFASGTSYNFCPNCGADMRGKEDA